MEAGTARFSQRIGLVELSTAVENSRRVRSRAQVIYAAAAATQVRVRDGQARALEAATTALDGDAPSSGVMASRQERLSGRVGRSPVIERAKARLVEQYGMSRGEAFELLTAVSNHSNRKLRDVAEELLRA